MTPHAARISGADAPIAARPAARIVGGYGYRVDGDTACLHAEIDWSPAAAGFAPWRLQLWARPVDDDSGGVVVAELPVGVPPHALAEPLYVEGYVAAMPPAGAGLHTMTLRLVAQCDTPAPVLHDRADFPQAARFLQPRLQALTIARGAGGVWTLHTERIVNPRPAGHAGGTLSLELWALAVPYRGRGPFDGCCLAALTLPALPGQGESGPLTLSFADPSERDAGRPWCLMLREWTPAGYVTRDCAGVVPPAPAAPGGLRVGAVRTVRPASAWPTRIAGDTAIGAAARRARPERVLPRPRAAGLGARAVAQLRQLLLAGRGVPAERF